VAADKNGNTYIGDEVNCKIYRIDAITGIITIAAGIGNKGVSNGDGGQATSASLMTPTGVTVDTSGNFYFVDNYNRVRKVTVATGIISTVAGNGVYAYSGDGGQATAASINRPFALAIDAANNLYIADRYNNAVRKVSAATGIISTIAGTGTAGHTGDGGPATAAQLNMPLTITVDQAGNVYVSHQNNPVIRRIDAVTGIISTFAGTGVRGFGGDGGPATSALFRILGGLATDVAGNVFVSDESNMRIRKIDIATGIINTIAGTGTVPGGYNGDQIPATTARFNEPRGICFDPAGNLLIADENNYRLRKVIYDTIPADTTAAFRIAVNDQPALNNIAAIYTSKVQPNPAHEQVIVSINGPIAGKTTITLTDMWGKVLIRQQKTLQQNRSFTTRLPLHQLAKGIYFVTIYASQKKQVHKLMVQ
jgi:hypothetical protein